MTVKPADDGNRLYLTFRGTDADGPTADGEAGTANGQMRYYEQVKALIDQVFDYVSDPHHHVSDIVVSGHSLGGTVADMFALYDGARFAALDGVKLSVIALASAGIDPGLLDLMPGYDHTLVDSGKGGRITFNTPDWYFQYDHANDIVRNPDKYDFAAHLGEDPTQAIITNTAVSLLKDHIHFEDNRLQFETPDIDQYAVSKNLETNFLVNHYADFYEMIGTEFSKAWPLARDESFDRFIALFGHSNVLDGTPGTNNVNGWGVSVDNVADYAKQASNLFMLCFSGDDTITTGGGADFVAGGADDDKIRSRGKADVLLGDIKGETGNDILRAGSGADMLEGGRGDDRLTGGGGADTFVFRTRSGADSVSDFEAAGAKHDVIDLSHMAGIASWDDLRAHHLELTDDGVIIEGGHGETVLLKDVARNDLSRADFLF